MCPACIAAVAWSMAGATTAGGVVALVAGKVRRKPTRTPESPAANRQGAGAAPAAGPEEIGTWNRIESYRPRSG